MYATIRRLQWQPGQASAIADLITAEYLPQLQDIAGAISYALVGPGDDIATSLGLFADEASAAEANPKALAWTKERLGPLVASPLDAAEGEVLVSESIH